MMSVRPSTMRGFLSTIIFASIISMSVKGVIAYTPALPVNDTSMLNITDASSIQLTWTDPPGEFGGGVWVVDCSPGDIVDRQIVST